MTLLGILVLSALVALIYLLWRVSRADADFSLLSKQVPQRDFFKDKVVWITGSSSGIGETLAEALSEDGALLILSSRNEKQLEEVRKSRTNLHNAKVLVLDLSKPESLAEVASRAWGLYGRIDILINNAGVSCRIPAEKVTDALLRQIMEVDFFGQITITQAVLPGMLERGCGQILNISSVVGKYALPFKAPYSAAKSALNAYMDTLRLDMAGKPISVSNIILGPVRTNVSKNSLLADGTTFGRTEDLVAHGMNVERCVDLILRAMASNVDEAWISTQPFLLFMYMSHYTPGLLKRIIREKYAEPSRGNNHSERKHPDM